MDEKDFEQDCENISRPELKKMKIVQRDKDSLLESFLQILRHSRLFVKMRSDAALLARLREEGKTDKRLQAALAMANFIEASYAKDGEARVEELANIVAMSRLSYPELTAMDDIEVALYLVYSSFRVLELESTADQGITEKSFRQSLVEFVLSEPKSLMGSNLLTDLLNCVYKDFVKYSKLRNLVEKEEDKLEELRSKINVVSAMAERLENMPNLTAELERGLPQIYLTKDYITHFTKLSNSYKAKLYKNLNRDMLNPGILKPVHLDLMPNKQAPMHLYPFGQDVSIGYFDLRLEFDCVTTKLYFSICGEYFSPFPLSIPVRNSFYFKNIGYLRLQERIYHDDNTFEDCISKILENDKIDFKDLSTMHRIVCLMTLDDDTKTLLPRFYPTNTDVYSLFEDADSQMMNRISRIGLVFNKSKRLLQQDAIKVFYHAEMKYEKNRRDIEHVVYVSKNDNDTVEDLLYGLMNTIKLSSMKEEPSEFIEREFRNCTFYLPLHCKTTEEVDKWRNINKQIDILLTRTLASIYDELVTRSGINYFTPLNKASHKTLSLHLPSLQSLCTKDLDLKHTSKEFQVVNVSLSSIYSYIHAIQESHYSLDWLLCPLVKYPSTLYLPRILVFKMNSLRSCIQIGKEFTMKFFEERIRALAEPLSARYSFIGLICQKKPPHNSQYYPVVKICPSNPHDKMCRGYIGEKEIMAPSSKIDNELVHYALFERY